jgi:hypothetical protein
MAVVLHLFLHYKIGISRSHVDEGLSLLACDVVSVAYNYQRLEEHISLSLGSKIQEKLFFVCFNSPKILRRLYKLILLVCYETTLSTSEIT